MTDGPDFLLDGPPVWVVAVIEGGALKRYDDPDRPIVQRDARILVRHLSAKFPKTEFVIVQPVFRHRVYPRSAPPGELPPKGGV